MWLMLGNTPAPDDYVVATGERHSVREFVDRAFSRAGLDYRRYVKTDPERRNLHHGSHVVQAVRIGDGGRREIFDLRGGSGCEQIV